MSCSPIVPATIEPIDEPADEPIDEPMTRSTVASSSTRLRYTPMCALPPPSRRRSVPGPHRGLQRVE